MSAQRKLRDPLKIKNELGNSNSHVEVFDNVLELHGGYTAHYHGYTCNGCSEHLGKINQKIALRRHQAEMINAARLALINSATS